MSKIIKSDRVEFVDLKPILINRVSVNENFETEEKGEFSLECKTDSKDNKIIAEAKEKAEKIIKDADEYKILKEYEIRQLSAEERDSAFKKGYNDGLEKGIYAGKKEALAKVEDEYSRKREDLVEEITSKIFEIDRKKQDILDKYEKDLILLAINMAEKILKNKLNIDEDTIKPMILDAIDNYKNEEWVNIYLNEDDYITISTDHELMDILNSSAEKVKIEAVHEATSCKLIIETKDTLIDASIDTQLNNMKDSLVD